MRVLIVGGNRFMGYGLTWRLLAAGHQVTHLNRGLTRDPFGERIERLPGDRTTGDFARLVAGRSFDAVVDFAAFVGADAASAVETLRGRVGHYVFISTGQVYLVREGCPWPAREIDYAGPVMPEPADAADKAEWEYGIGKRACEDRLAEAWARNRFPFTCLRIPMVDGERDNKRRLEAYLWRILDGGPLIVPEGDLRPVRHVYAGAVVRAIVDLLGKPASFGQAYNLSQDEMPALSELITLFADALGAPTRLHPVPAEKIRAAGLRVTEVSPYSSVWMSCLDPARARAELGFRHESLAEYAGRIVASFLAHPPADPPPGYAGRGAELQLASRPA
jgi:nucleoside-diphosphate-sugar epimerase